MNEKNLGLKSVVATGVGLIVATSCLLSLGIGSAAIGETFIISMVIACVINMFTALSVAELNALMPNLTGGLAQYTLACMGPLVTIITMVGGYVLCNTIAGSVECAMFGNVISSVLPDIGIPAWVYSVVLLVILLIANLNGIDMFVKIQDIVAYGLIISLIIMGLIGAFDMGTGSQVEQPAVLASDFKSVTSMCGIAFFLFIGSEYVVPISKQVKNAKRNIPLGMIISLVVILGMQVLLVLGFKKYTLWEELGASAAPHILYGEHLLGNFGKIWMAMISVLAVVSSVNTVISSLAYISMGMAKINLLPAIFLKTNKKGAPYVGILVIAGIMVIINITGLSTSDKLSFLILTLCVFWMIAYIVSNLNVIILRKRLPKAPRTFKLPFGCTIPVLGIIGTIWMIYNIDSNPVVRMEIYKVCGVILIFLIAYSFIWVRWKMNKPLFKPYAIKDVMAMENELYRQHHMKK